MEIAKIILEYVRVLAWPLTIGFILVAFKNPIAALFRRMNSAELFGLRASFIREVAELTEISEDKPSSGNGIPATDLFHHSGEDVVASVPNFSGLTAGQGAEAVYSYAYYIVALLREHLTLQVVASRDPSLLATVFREFSVATDVPYWVELAEVMERMKDIMPNSDVWPGDLQTQFVASFGTFCERLRKVANYTLSKEVQSKTKH